MANNTDAQLIEFFRRGAWARAYLSTATALMLLLSIQAEMHLWTAVLGVQTGFLLRDTMDRIGLYHFARKKSHEQDQL